jgi:ligand-binding sensor domain-containing protein
MSERYLYVTGDRGVYRYDWLHNEWKVPFTNFDLLLDSRINRIFFEPEWDDLYFITRDGAFRVNENVYGKQKPSKIVLSHYPEFSDSCPRVLNSIIPPAGMFFDNTNREFTDVWLNKYPITCCIDDNLGSFWIGTEKAGLMRLNTRSGFTERISLGIATQDVKAICVGKDGVYFAGSGAVSLYRDDGQWLSVSSDTFPALPSLDATSIIVVSESLFIGTNEGVAILNSWTLRPLKFLNRFNGLLGEEVTSLARINDGILIGTKSGLTFYDLFTGKLKMLTVGNFNAITVFQKKMIPFG